jgi:Glycosyltransferase family 92
MHSDLKKCLCRFEGHNMVQTSEAYIDWHGIDGYFRDVHKRINDLCFLSCPFPRMVGVDTPLEGWDVSPMDDQNTSLHSPVAAEVIAVLPPEERGVRVCMGAVYAHVPQTVDAVINWSKFKVKKVYMYAAEYTDDEWKEAGYPTPYYPPVLFTHHLVDWMIYKPVRGVFSHSHILTNNDCLKRHRYEADFLAFYDTDEFLVFPKSPPKDLLTWLLEKTPPKGAGVCTSVRALSFSLKICMLGIIMPRGSQVGVPSSNSPPLSLSFSLSLSLSLSLSRSLSLSLSRSLSLSLSLSCERQRQGAEREKERDSER